MTLNQLLTFVCFSLRPAWTAAYGFPFGAIGGEIILAAALLFSLCRLFVARSLSDGDSLREARIWERRKAIMFV